MTKKTDIELVRCLLVSALTGAALYLFWLIFTTIKDYQHISYQIEDYLQKSLLVMNGTEVTDLASDEVVDQMLEKRLESMKELLSLLIHVVVVLFGFVASFLDINPLIATFALIVTSGLITNLFIPILYSNAIIVLAVILFTISWLYFDLNTGAKEPDETDQV